MVSLGLHRLYASEESASKFCGKEILWENGAAREN